jgi:hypothetical protein
METVVRKELAVEAPLRVMRLRLVCEDVVMALIERGALAFDFRRSGATSWNLGQVFRMMACWLNGWLGVLNGGV